MPVGTPLTEQHKWLAKFEGSWTTTMSNPSAPGMPAVESTGSLESESLGGHWMINRYEADMNGEQFKAIQTIGFNSEKKKFVGTWVDSITDQLWLYEGELDESGKKLILEAEGPSMIDDRKTALFRDAYEFQSDDLIIATSSIQDANGKWIEFMSGQMKRKK
ncbi:MAG: DUF1579 domain-containing protein [Pirellulaceae bacterium]